MRWTQNSNRGLPAEAQRGTVSLRSLDTTCVALGEAEENSRWNLAQEYRVEPMIRRLPQCDAARAGNGPVVVPLDRLVIDSEPVGHLVFSSVVRVHGHPPSFRSEAKARWYLRQLEAAESRRYLWNRLGSSRRQLLVVLPAGSFAISDWATIPLKASIGELLLLPISPSHAVLAAPRSTSVAHLESLLSALPLADISEAVDGVQICLWTRPGEDLRDPRQRVTAAERVRSNMSTWRDILPLRASVHDELDE